jgi:hypothetical protein
MQIFTEPLGEGGGLPVSVVLQHLQDVEKMRAPSVVRMVSSNSSLLSIPDSSLFGDNAGSAVEGRNALRLMYLSRMLDLLLGPRDGSCVALASLSAQDECDVATQALQLLLEQILRFKTSLRKGQGGNVELLKASLAEVTQRFRVILSSSLKLDCPLLLRHLPLSCMQHERVLLLKRLGRHEDVLTMLMHNGTNVSAAEDYCESVYDTDPNVYHHMLRVCVHPPHGHRPLLQLAASLLVKHGHRMDVLQALALLPPSMPLQLLQPYLECTIRRSAELLRDSLLRRNMLRGHHVDVKVQLLQQQAQRVVIGTDSSCVVCNRKIGALLQLHAKRFLPLHSQLPAGNSVFAMTPEGALLHYGCFQVSAGPCFVSPNVTLRIRRSGRWERPHDALAQRHDEKRR